jgi:hypothetical protein
MPYDMKTLEAQVTHECKLVARKGAKRVIRSIREARGLGGVAVAAQVGTYNGVITGEPHRDFGPHGMVLREPVKQQNWRPGSSNRACDLDFVQGYRAA